jgi:hypothetical protein
MASVLSLDVILFLPHFAADDSALVLPSRGKWMRARYYSESLCATAAKCRVRYLLLVSTGLCQCDYH